MSKVYILGHKHPDTDSICSVIGYADLLNRFEPDKYIPARCGELNAETEFVLSHLEIIPPMYIESVDPKVSDIQFPSPISAVKDAPTIDIAKLMELHGIKNIPITDENGTLVGLVSESDLAKAYVTRLKIEQLHVFPIKVETLAKILKAQIIFSSREVLDGKVYTVIDALHVALSKLTKDDVAIVGDNEPAQLALITSGIAALIIANGAPVGERVIKTAKEKGTPILATELDAFGVGKMINLSLPVEMIMTPDVPILRPDDSIEYAKKLVYGSKFRTACVIDDDKKLLGVVTRTTLLQDVRKSVILLDHNEYTQAVDGIEEADILEIIDHHRIGTVNTLKPVKFLNDPVGSTSTIITTKFIESGVEPTKKIAAVLLSGILSDTLVMKLSTTTSKDLKAIDYLSKIADIDPNEYGTKLIEAGMKFDGLSLEEVITRDVKKYMLFGKNVMISQVMVSSFDYVEKQMPDIKNTLEKLKESNGVDCFFTLFTNIFENTSDLFVSADEICLSKLEMRNQPVRLKGVMSRKKDFLPQLGQMLRNM